MSDENPEDNIKEQNVQVFKAQVQAKIQNLLDEFAAGKISRAQFHLLYERYSARLAIAEHAMFSGNPDAVAIAQTGPSTLDIRSMTEGKATGMMVYHHRSARVLETLGLISVAVKEIAPTLNNIAQMVEQGKRMEPHLEKVGQDNWLLFVTRQLATVITEFRNEPSRLQIRTIERMLNDFEEANRILLAMETIDSDKLAYPFLAFVQKTIKK